MRNLKKETKMYKVGDRVIAFDLPGMMGTFKSQKDGDDKAVIIHDGHDLQAYWPVAALALLEDPHLQVATTCSTCGYFEVDGRRAFGQCLVRCAHPIPPKASENQWYLQGADWLIKYGHLTEKYYLMAVGKRIDQYERMVAKKDKLMVRAKTIYRETMVYLDWYHNNNDKRRRVHRNNVCRFHRLALVPRETQAAVLVEKESVDEETD